MGTEGIVILLQNVALGKMSGKTNDNTFYVERRLTVYISEMAMTDRFLSEALIVCHQYYFYVILYTVQN